jgi:beta-phosphoglucomutase-like phosphatase (HAD superfamily)
MTNLLNKNIASKIYLIFDLDGTLIHTDEANFLSYQEAIKNVKNIDLKLIYNDNERFTREKLNFIIPNLTVQEFKKTVEIKTKVFRKYLKHTKLNTFILELINKFSKTNKIILATNSHKMKANLLLNHYDIFDLFNKKYYKEDYAKADSKYQYIINDLSVNLNDIIIFEDNCNEIYKAINLGILPENIINPNTKGKNKI